VVDLDALMKVEAECFTDYYEAHRFSQDQFRYYLNNPQTIAYVATIDRRIVGYVLGIKGRGQRSGIARLHSIAVVKKQRKQRIGKKLLRAFIAKAARAGVNKVMLEVASDNTRAIAMFTTEKFHKTTTLANYYGKRFDGMRMAREL